jgi:hypothetical protein
MTTFSDPSLHCCQLGGGTRIVRARDSSESDQVSDAANRHIAIDRNGLQRPPRSIGLPGGDLSLLTGRACYRTTCHAVRSSTSKAGRTTSLDGRIAKPSEHSYKRGRYEASDTLGFLRIAEAQGGRRQSSAAG